MPAQMKTSAWTTTLTTISVVPVLQQKRRWGIVLRIPGALAIFFIIPGSIAQEHSPYVIDTASMQQILAKSSDPEPVLGADAGHRL